MPHPPLYAARVSDVLASPGAVVVATCEGCTWAIAVPREALAALPGSDRVIDLQRRVRCSCGHSAGSVWVRWPEAEVPAQ